MGSVLTYELNTQICSDFFWSNLPLSIQKKYLQTLELREKEGRLEFHE